MAATRKAPAAEVEAALAACLATCTQSGDHLVVALSGGVDSMVLFHYLSRLAPAAGLRLSALHVNHQLSPNADAWASFCQAEADRRGVPIAVHRVQVHPSGEGVEAAARAARLQAFAALNADFVVLGHHQNDQAETLLLQLLRGAGIAGLAGMPLLRRSRGPALLRPLLGLPRATLQAAATAAGLSHVEDESNCDPAYDRNCLRLHILPALSQRWPNTVPALSRSAAHVAEALALLEEVGDADLAALAAEGGLDLAHWRQLSAPRARNVLRRFLQRQDIVLKAARFDALHAALGTTGMDASVLEQAGGLLLARYRDRLEIVPAHPPAAPYDLAWDGCRLMVLPDGSELHFVPTPGAGMRAAVTDGVAVRIRSRVGGERLRLAAGRPSRSLKNLFQEAGVPSWRRRQPIIWVDGAVAAVPGIGVDASWQAPPGETGLTPVQVWP